MTSIKTVHNFQNMWKSPIGQPTMHLPLWYNFVSTVFEIQSTATFIIVVHFDVLVPLNFIPCVLIFSHLTTHIFSWFSSHFTPMKIQSQYVNNFDLSTLLTLTFKANGLTREELGFFVEFYCTQSTTWIFEF